MKRISNFGYLALIAVACVVHSRHLNAQCPQFCDYTNTALGFNAFIVNATGTANAALGEGALFSNTTGSYNTATGFSALLSNTRGINNTAMGWSALNFNTTGLGNTGYGNATLQGNRTGNFNTAIGNLALNSMGEGTRNIALGHEAGANLHLGDANIYIGNRGRNGESNTIRIGEAKDQTATFIAGIVGATIPNGVRVIVGLNGQLGTVTASVRFKDNVKPMDKASEAILALNPVTFRYKRELDPDRIPQFGLVAEEVAKVDPDLVARDEQGKPYTVRYEAVNAMLLNEFLKAHQTIETQEKKIQALELALKQQGTQIEKISAQLSSRRSAARLVVNE